MILHFMNEITPFFKLEVNRQYFFSIIENMRRYILALFHIVIYKYTGCKFS